MIATASLGMRFSGRKLFEDVNLKFTPGNCYGVIGANGAGKSTFVKILSGELEATEGEVIFDKNKRMSVLKQDHFQYEDEEVLNVVLMGNKKLWDIMVEKNVIYAKTDFTDEDGIRAAELEGEFAELNGWEAETEAETLLMGLKIGADLHHKLMKELTEPEKVKVLLAQALFGEPDVLLLDEPTNGLDVKAISWLENFIMGLENSTVIVVSHDRHFLNKVCTHITDIDYGKIKMYVGNYDFWYESNELMKTLINNKNKKLEQKRQELQEFIARFSANASKSKQATSRKKQLEKLQLEDMQMSNRKYPFVEFKPEREAGNNLLKVENLSKTIEGVKVLLAQALFGEPDVLLLDEPTNGLDVKAISWLENFIMGLENSTVIVVSHDRHFLNKVCTHITDIDYGKIKMYVGNYDFWYESNELMKTLINNKNKKLEQKRQELQEFIARFSANASKSKQATSRKKQLEKLQLEDMQMSNRKYPFIEFKPEREAGNNLLKVENLSKTIEGVKVLDNVSFTIETGDKVVFLAKNDLVKTTLLSILAGEIEPDSGTYTWGVTTSQAYMPRDNSKYFNNSDLNLIDWLRPYSPDEHEAFIRGFLGRMLFSGDETLKKVSVLSGGEKVRCMLSKLMLSGANVLLFDNPSDHLDLESITSLNKALIKFKGTILFGAHDHEFIQTVANRIIEITPKGLVDKVTTYDEYLEDETIQVRLDEMYNQ